MSPYRGVIICTVSRLLGCAAVSMAGLMALVGLIITYPVSSASSQLCPDVQVVFARGTGEDPGVGATGQAFVDDLRWRLGGKSLAVYAVNYPASYKWDTSIDGIRDAGSHIASMVHDCPNTQMVLGGYSQGAAVMGFVTSVAVPDWVDPATTPEPMDPDVANHVSSIVLFGMPNLRAMSFFDEPRVAPSRYELKTIKVCAPGDPVCSDGLDLSAHNSYARDGAIIDRGTSFAAARLAGFSPRSDYVVLSPGGSFAT